MPDKQSQQPKRLVLIDAHAVLHRAYHALPDFASSKGEPTGALYGLASILMKIMTDLAPDYVAACYDMPGATFRHEAYEKYKAQRPETEDDLKHQMQRSRDVFTAFGIPIYQHEGFEADDVIGTIVEQTAKDVASGELEVIIASGDMDTMQLVRNNTVRVYTMKKGVGETVMYDEDAVKERFGVTPALVPDIKGLQGDPSDNIPGVSGIGEKTAKQLVATFGTIEDIYETLKKDERTLADAGIKPRVVNLLRDGEEEALFSKTLATIRTDVPITFALPEKSWRETYSTDDVATLFSELEFRTLADRARALANHTEDTEADAPDERETVDEEEIARVGIALWLVDSNITNPAREDILHYAGTQSFDEAKELIMQKLDERNLRRVYENIELPLRPILLRMRERGVLINTDYLTELSSELHEQLEIIRADIYKHAGREFNINSPAQLGEVLFTDLGISTRGIKKTEGGAISTRESELQKIADAHPIVARILEYRELQKLLSTYIDNLPTLVGDDDRLHTTFLQTGTTTGRLASKEPNMQNIPTKGDYGQRIRRAFVADAECHLLALDYSQIELRILALLSGDEALTHIFTSGGDVHASVAARVFGVAEDAVTKDQRRKAKVINFGIVYGMGVTSLQKNLGTSRKEAQSFYDEYFAQFPGVAAYLDGVKRETAKRGYTETLFGRRRPIDGIHSSIPYVRASAERMAINAPIQGTAADVIKLAMIDAEQILAEESTNDTHLLLQVHDELIYELPEKDIQEHAALIKQTMENVLTARGHDAIPLIVDASHGKSWGEMETINDK